MIRKALMVACAAAALVTGYNQAHAETWQDRANQAWQQQRPMRSPARASNINWVLAAEAGNGDSRWYYDANNVSQKDEYRLVIIRMDEPDGGRSVFRSLVDCSDASFTFTYVLDNGRWADTEVKWTFFSRDSNIGAIAQEVC